MDRHHPPAPSALVDVVDLGVSIIGRALTAFRRDPIDAAVAEARAVGARCAKVEMTPGVWQLRLSHRDEVAELSLVGDGAPAGVVGRWYMARPGRQGPRPVVVVVHGRVRPAAGVPRGRRMRCGFAHGHLGACVGEGAR